MMTIVIVFIIIFAVLHEFLGLTDSLEKLYYKGELDKVLVEPGEEITLCHSVVNQSWLPVLYINLMAPLHEKAKSAEKVVSDKYRMYLPGYRKWKTNVRFSLNKRGSYRFGHYYIEAGDIFGINSKVRSGDANHEIVVMPDKTNAVAVWKAYNGFIGDVSVQRFILEDPVFR